MYFYTLFYLLNVLCNGSPIIAVWFDNNLGVSTFLLSPKITYSTKQSAWNSNEDNFCATAKLFTINLKYFKLTIC